MTPRSLGLAAAALIATAFAVLVVQPLGALRGTMLLVVVLPPIAHALDGLGWAEIIARRIAGGRPGERRVLAAYATWLVLSALLTLDVAAVVATPVGLVVARRWQAGERVLLGAAILGSNVGSMLFPFSNLTNLLLVAGTGIGFTTFVATAALPQVGAALAVGWLLAWRTQRRGTFASAAVATANEPARPTPTATEPPRPTSTSTAAEPPRPTSTAAGPPPPTPVPANAKLAGRPIGRGAATAGAAAALGAAAAVVVGVGGGDVSLVFAVVAAATAAVALIENAVTTGGLLRSIPVSGVVVVLAAAVARQPMLDVATALPHPDASLPPFLALPIVALVGGLLAAAVNNLPAAAFGSVWLVGAGAPVVVAYLLGANILNLITPHGSLATILGRNLARTAGLHVPASAYVRDAWAYAVVGTAAGLLPLMFFAAPR